MLVAAGSHIGLVRQTNQDVFRVIDGDSSAIKFLVLADGMGGASAGEVASRIAVDTVSSKLQQVLEDGTASVDWVETLRGAVLSANQQVWQSAQENEEYYGMGTTLEAAICDDENVVFAHVGDSRGYLMHVNYLKQITRDHSLVAELVRRGQLTPAEAVNHPQRNIVTRSLGTARDLLVDVDLVKWQSGDAILLCSDGLSNLINERELLEHMLPLRVAANIEDVESVIQGLLQLGLDRGAPDNITLAIAVHNEGNDAA